MQTIDALVSKTKFREEIERFRVNESMQRVRGISLLKAEFPNAYFQFAAPQLLPSPVIYTIVVNFDDYDLQPLSVQFIHPFTFETAVQLTHLMPRKVINEGGGIEHQVLIQKEPTGNFFICMPGVREYHAHPAHSGDHWLLHRNIGGEGCLGFIIDKIHQYGVQAIGQYLINLQFQMPAVALTLNPEL